jgi:CBS-domain-containing membrane protein
MSAPAVTISPDDPVSQAAQLMLARRVRRLPVVGADGRLAGIVSRADVLAVYTRPDDDICREITRDVIMDGFFMDPAQFTVTVADGIVTLEGSPDTAVVADCIVEQVRHMEGVVAVRERLTQQAS